MILLLKKNDNCFYYPLFLQCKEKMRPVKKSLKALGRLDQKKSKHDQHEKERMTQGCLVKIGQHIDKCLAEMKDSEKRRVWRK